MRARKRDTREDILADIERLQDSGPDPLDPLSHVQISLLIQQVKGVIAPSDPFLIDCGEPVPTQTLRRLRNMLALKAGHTLGRN